MTRINEIFASLQGEGLRTGVPAVFIRLAGCNLRCSFCDTDFERFTEMDDDAVVAEARRYDIPRVVITGGEPSLQIGRPLLGALKEAGFEIQMETNGSIDLPDDVLAMIDHITCSPKDGAPVRLRRIDEVKLVYAGDGRDEARCAAAEDLASRFGAPCLLQPCDTGNAERNNALCAEAVAWVMAHPAWRLSLQTHKLLNIR